MNAHIAVQPVLNSDLDPKSFCLAELSDLGLIDFNFTTDLISNCRDQRCAAAPSEETKEETGHLYLLFEGLVVALWLWGCNIRKVNLSDSDSD